MGNKLTYHELSYSLNEENPVLFCLNIRGNVRLRFIPVEAHMDSDEKFTCRLRKLLHLRGKEVKKANMYEPGKQLLLQLGLSRPHGATLGLCPKRTSCKA